MSETMRERSGIALLREGLSPDARGHVLRLPRWAMPESPEGYWHCPRSAEVHFNDHGIVRFWCGQTRHMRLSRMTNRTPPDMRCATCEGRAAGYERKDGAIYRPRSAWDMPRHCPAYYDNPDSDRCWLCDARIKYRFDYGGYRESPHRPGERLAAHQPCPRHGWKHAKSRDGVLRCSAWRCDFRGVSRTA